MFDGTDLMDPTSAQHPAGLAPPDTPASPQRQSRRKPVSDVLPEPPGPARYAFRGHQPLKRLPQQARVFSYTSSANSSGSSAGALTSRVPQLSLAVSNVSNASRTDTAPGQQTPALYSRQASSSSALPDSLAGPMAGYPGAAAASQQDSAATSDADEQQRVAPDQQRCTQSRQQFGSTDRQWSRGLISRGLPVQLNRSDSAPAASRPGTSQLVLEFKGPESVMPLPHARFSRLLGSIDVQGAQSGGGDVGTCEVGAGGAASGLLSCAPPRTPRVSGPRQVLLGVHVDQIGLTALATHTAAPGVPAIMPIGSRAAAIAAAAGQPGSSSGQLPPACQLLTSPRTTLPPSRPVGIFGMMPVPSPVPPPATCHPSTPEPEQGTVTADNDTQVQIQQGDGASGSVLDAEQCKADVKPRRRRRHKAGVEDRQDEDSAGQGPTLQLESHMGVATDTRRAPQLDKGTQGSAGDGTGHSHGLSSKRHKAFLQGSMQLLEAAASWRKPVLLDLFTGAVLKKRHDVKHLILLVEADPCLGWLAPGTLGGPVIHTTQPAASQPQTDATGQRAVAQTPQHEARAGSKHRHTAPEVPSAGASNEGDQPGSATATAHKAARRPRQPDPPTEGQLRAAARLSNRARQRRRAAAARTGSSDSEAAYSSSSGRSSDDSQDSNSSGESEHESESQSDQSEAGGSESDQSETSDHDSTDNTASDSDDQNNDYVEPSISDGSDVNGMTTSGNIRNDDMMSHNRQQSQQSQHGSQQASATAPTRSRAAASGSHAATSQSSNGDEPASSHGARGSNRTSHAAGSMLHAAQAPSEARAARPVVQPQHGAHAKVHRLGMSLDDGAGVVMVVADQQPPTPGSTSNDTSPSGRARDRTSDSSHHSHSASGCATQQRHSVGGEPQSAAGLVTAHASTSAGSSGGMASSTAAARSGHGAYVRQAAGTGKGLAITPFPRGQQGALKCAGGLAMPQTGLVSPRNSEGSVVVRSVPMSTQPAAGGNNSKR